MCGDLYKKNDKKQQQPQQKQILKTTDIPIIVNLFNLVNYTLFILVEVEKKSKFLFNKFKL